MLKKNRFMSFLLFPLLFLLGVVSPLHAFQMQVAEFYYSDTLRTIDDYDFLTGSKTGDIITIPSEYVSGDGLTYTFGIYPGTTGLTLSWSPGSGSCILQTSTGVGDTESIQGAAIQTTGVPGAAKTAWTYSIMLNTFTETTDGGRVYVGMVSSADGNQPEI